MLLAFAIATVIVISITGIIIYGMIMNYKFRKQQTKINNFGLCTICKSEFSEHTDPMIRACDTQRIKSKMDFEEQWTKYNWSKI